MQVYYICQEMLDVWIIVLLCYDYYFYCVGQYVLVSVCNLVEMLCVYIFLFMLGVSEYIMLIVCWIEDGMGLQWLIYDIKCGDYIWLFDVMGDFICDDKIEDKFLLFVVGCGVMLIMLMCCWLVKYCLQVDVQVIFNVCLLDDVIFVDEW